MFIDKLRMSVAMQQYAKIVKPSDDALEFNPVDEKKWSQELCFADGI